MSAHGRVAGKVIIVTGAGSIGDGWGNGKAAAVLYAREGASVVAVDRNAAAAEETVALIEAEGGTADAAVADVTRQDDVLGVVDLAMRLHGRIDVLHNNVGIGVLGSTVEVTEKSWDLVYRVNVKSAFLCGQAVLPVMRDQRSGAVVSISSVAGQRWLGVPYAAYASSKAALTQFSRAIAIEFAKDGIRSNVVTPGYIDTPTVYAGQLSTDDGRDAAARLADRRAAATPTGRQGTPWDVAYASLFLASDEAAYVNGAEIVVDGGLSLLADR